MLYLSSEPIENLLHSDGTDIDWSRYQQMKCNRVDTFIIQCKTYQNSDEDLRLNRKSPVYTFANTSLGRFNSQPISTAKYNDLQDLLCEILPEYHEFYTTIAHDDKGDATDYGLCYHHEN